MPFGINLGGGGGGGGGSNSGGGFLNQVTGKAKDAFNTVDRGTKSAVDATLDNERFSVQEGVQGAMTAAYRTSSGDQDATAEDVADEFQDTASNLKQRWDESTPDADSGGASGALGGALKAGGFVGEALVADPTEAAFTGLTGVDIEEGSTEGEVGAVDVADIGITVATAGAGKAGVSALKGASKADEGGRLLSKLPGVSGADEAAGAADDLPALADDAGGAADDLPALSDDVGAGDDALKAVDESGDAVPVTKVGGKDEPADLFNPGKLTDDAATKTDDGLSAAEDAGSAADDLPALADETDDLAQQSGRFRDYLARGGDDASRPFDDAAKAADDVATSSDDAARFADDAAGFSDEGARFADDVAKASDDAARFGDDAARFGDDAASASDDAARAGDDVAKASDDVAKGADDAAKSGRWRSKIGTKTKVGAGILAGGAAVGAMSGNPREAPDEMETESGHTLTGTKEYEPTQRFQNGGKLYRVTKDGTNRGYWLLVGVQGRNLIVVTKDGSTRKAKITKEQFKQMVQAQQNGGSA